MSLSAFIVVLKTGDGQTKEWDLIAESMSKAVMAAAELCPNCEVIKVRRRGEW